jgi:hypothetical protein
VTKNIKYNTNTTKIIKDILGDIKSNESVKIENDVIKNRDLKLKFGSKSRIDKEKQV